MFTKEELEMKRRGYYDLAIAVVKQWVKDGKPVNEWKNIRPYIQVIKEYEVKAAK